MFDFFRDVLLEARGIDSVAAGKERKYKYEVKRLNRFIFSKSAKVVLYVLGVFYLVLAATSILSLNKAGDDEMQMIKYVCFAALDIAICICLMIGKRKSEIAAVIGIALFILLNYLALILI